MNSKQTNLTQFLASSKQGLMTAAHRKETDFKTDEI